MSKDLQAEAMRLIDNALAKPPTELSAEVDDAERAVAALRDALIDRFRQAPTSDLRRNLDGANVALSYLVGLEYPMGGLQRDMLQQARAALADVRTSDLLA